MKLFCDSFFTPTLFVAYPTVWYVQNKQPYEKWENFSCDTKFYRNRNAWG